MRVPFRKCMVAALIGLSPLTACGTVARRVELVSTVPQAVATRVGPPTKVAPPTNSARRPAVGSVAWFQRLPPRKRVKVVAYLKAVQVNIFLQALWEAMYGIPPDLTRVVVCIYDHESGDPAEHSHPAAGSGRAQYIPSTWRYWFGRWRAASPNYHGPDYPLAWLAPGYLQDGVLVFTLRNGGASNWSPRYGNDPCTVGM